MEDESCRRRNCKSVRIGRTRVGKGVFARRIYRASAMIGEILGHVIDQAGYGSEYCMDIGDGLSLEPEPPFCYVNHSCEPNCEFDWFVFAESASQSSRRRAFLFALREIRPGEELTIDYGWSASSAIRCSCGAPNCRGWIVAEDEVPMVAEENVRRSA